jgi:predicted dehydrogenase
MAEGALVVLGCGRIAHRHAAAARRLGWPLLFASRDASRAREYARRHGGLDAHGSYEAALADPRAGAVVVCTPHDRHLPDARAVLAAGRHVLVEKPIARTLTEADRMLEAAARAGRVLMVGENFHYMPAFRRVHALIRQGRLGALRELHLVARGYRRPSDWRTRLDASGGGTLIDGGIHYVHLLRWWGGEVTRLYAVRPPPTVAEAAGEDAVAVLAELAGGAIGFLANSLGAPGVAKVQWSTITGSRATCLVDNRGRFLLVRGGGRPYLRLFRRDPRGHEAMLTDFRDAIRTGRTPGTDGTSGRRDLAVVLAAYRSLAEGRVVEVAC